MTAPAQTPGSATIAPNPGPAPGEPAPPAAGATWMRRLFGLFLDHAGSPFANLSEPQRDVLFAEFLVWRRTRASADHADPAQPGPEDGGKVQAP